MRPRLHPGSVCVSLGVTLVLGTSPARAHSTAFTYQGRLTDAAAPANGQ